MLTNEQTRRGLTENQAAIEIGVMQQSFSSWKHGTLPRPNKYAAIAGWLGTPIAAVRDLIEEAKNGIGDAKPPEAPSATYGRVSDRKEGKYRFDPVGEAGWRYPPTLYAVWVGTNVMEPALPYGTRAWADPTVWPKPGHEVIAHGPKGVAWLGRLASLDDGRAVVENASGRITINDLQAIHVIVLSERVPGGT